MTDTSKSKQSSDTKSNEPEDFDKEALPDKIGSSLRQLYDDVLSEDVPDDFLALLRKADNKGAGSGASQ